MSVVSWRSWTWLGLVALLIGALTASGNDRSDGKEKRQQPPARKGKEKNETPIPKDKQELPGPIHPYIVANSIYEGQFHCPICELGLHPGVLILARPDFSNPAAFATLLKRLDNLIAKHPRARLGGIVVFTYEDLTNVVTQDEKRALHAQDVRKVKLGAEGGSSISKVIFCLDSQANLRKQGYDLEELAEVQVILYHKLRIINTYNFNKDKLTDKSVETILGEIETQLGR